MFKVVVSNPSLASRLMAQPVLGKLFTFDVANVEHVHEQALRDEMLSAFVTECRHGKTTGAGRFSSLDQTVCELLPKGVRQVVHDVAASSGITSCDLYDALGPDRIEAFYLSDKYARYSIHGRWVKRIVGADGRILRADALGILADPHAGRFFPGSRLAYWLVSKLPLPEASRQELLLLDPKAKRYIEEGRFQFLDYDVFQPGELERFSFVRCMNLLNANSWFSEEQLLLGLRNLEGSLRRGGLMQIGRTGDDGRSEVSFFAKEGDGMREVRAVNGGTELRPLIRRDLGWRR